MHNVVKPEFQKRQIPRCFIASRNATTRDPPLLTTILPLFTSAHTNTTTNDSTTSTLELSLQDSKISCANPPGTQGSRLIICQIALLIFPLGSGGKGRKPQLFTPYNPSSKKSQTDFVLPQKFFVGDFTVVVDFRSAASNSARPPARPDL